MDQRREAAIWAMITAAAHATTEQIEEAVRILEGGKDERDER